jgi:hypothetical protein
MTAGTAAASTWAPTASADAVQIKSIWRACPAIFHDSSTDQQVNRDSWRGTLR